MALVSKATDAAMDTATGQFAPQIAGDLYAGEALGAVDACYIKGSDGKVYKSNGTALNEAAKFDGFTPCAYSAGEAVTLFGVGARFRYATGMTPGADLYVATTAGGLDTAATTGGTRAVARAISATDIRVTRNSDAD